MMDTSRNVPRVGILQHCKAVVRGGWAAWMVWNALTCRAAEKVDFARDVQPILSRHCLACHGPDAASREADLRLDRHADATSPRPNGRIPFAPGEPDRSEALRRIRSDDPDHRMPPAPHAPLAEKEIEIVTRWIAQGAHWRPHHWAFVPVTRPQVPSCDEWINAEPCRNAIDRFVRNRLRQFGLRPAKTADRATLIRRVTLDLTGIPPTEDEVEAFENDPRPDAYERLVDRLLASPAYGERMATPWLDAARYADTNGYEQDNGREMWAWRDWVIHALNVNQPFDQFTIEQLAGDLIPGATDQQILATGFHRNHGLNFEGGSISEESRWNYVFDRVNTTATVWLGLTLACARCHDHKYDPFTQADYYRMAAFFNNVDEEGYAGEHGNAEPLLPLPDPERQARMDDLQQQIADLERSMAQPVAEATLDLDRWMRGLLTGRDRPPDPPTDWELYDACEPLGGASPAGRENVAAPTVTTGALRFVPGHRGQAAAFDGQTRLDFGDVASFERDQEFSYGAWIYPTDPAFGPIVARVYYQGYDLCWYDGYLEAHLVNRWDNNAIFVRTRERFPLNTWLHAFVTYDGSSRASGVSIYVNGRRQPCDVTMDSLSDSIVSESTLHVGARSATTPECFTGLIDEVLVYPRRLSMLEVALLADDPSFLDSARKGRWTPEQEQILREHYVCRIDPTYAGRLQRLRELQDELQRERAEWPTTMVMRERQERRPTPILRRGQYDQPGDLVEPGVPRALAPETDARHTDRLALARWLVDRRQPLTARVMVNRHWMLFFPHPLVETVDDFGAQGDPPSHPELLDWLAAEFMDSGWDVKRLHRLIVTSATYRQTTWSEGEARELDPENRWLGRQSRRRLTAEMIRDQALAVSGLLDQRMGGPGVRPSQPEGLWSDLSFLGEYTSQEYQPSEGGDRYRRAVYTFWKRACPPPAMQLFDAGDREVCQVRRACTQTPLQALVLLNDPTILDACRALARQSRSAMSDEARIDFLFRRVLARSATPEERATLEAYMAAARQRFTRDPERARQLAACDRDERVDDGSPIDLACWTLVAHLVLTLDEALTRN